MDLLDWLCIIFTTTQSSGQIWLVGICAHNFFCIKMEFQLWTVYMNVLGLICYCFHDNSSDRWTCKSKQMSSGQMMLRFTVSWQAGFCVCLSVHESVFVCVSGADAPPNPRVLPVTRVCETKGRFHRVKAKKPSKV